MVRKFITGAAVALGLAAPLTLNSTAQANDYYRPIHHGHGFHHRHHKSYCLTYRRGYEGPWYDYGTYGSYERACEARAHLRSRGFEVHMRGY